MTRRAGHRRACIEGPGEVIVPASGVAPGANGWRFASGHGRGGARDNVCCFRVLCVPLQIFAVHARHTRQSDLTAIATAASQVYPMKGVPSGMTSAARSAPAAARNCKPILLALRDCLPRSARVLEIASGTGEHAVWFSGALSELTWQPTDRDPEALRSIAA